MDHLIIARLVFYLVTLVFKQLLSIVHEIKSSFDCDLTQDVRDVGTYFLIFPKRCMYVTRGYFIN